MSNLRQLIRTTLLENQTEIDRILDKISSNGLDNISPYEKQILNKSSAGKSSSVETDAIAWLNKNFGELQTEKMVRNSFGRKIEEIVFFDDNMDTVITLETQVWAVGATRQSNIIFIDNVIWEKLQGYFGLDESQSKDILKRWVGDAYGFKDVVPSRSF